MVSQDGKQWFALYTRPRWEKKVTELLDRKKIQVYCPLNKVQRQWSDRKKIVHEPLFSSYVFVCLSPEEQTKALQTDGVINFVYWLHKPAVIRNDEIDAIRRFLNEYENVSLEKCPVNMNDTVRILNGPLMTWEGQVVEVRANTIKVMLPSLGQCLVAEFRKENVEKVIHPVSAYHMKAV
ncbi:transcription termination/antitermination protein NusG [Terrimonas ferruginea]|jgi:transcription antitermination factor NusG|uniref:transcription termination/antitermination protein NusG n=1 Tax=Terrimonas ferruginea TaxID=249 RepID=UPI00040CED9E|nr:UpxY family transcription antiterminator [Terrimonas ferruginea]